MLLENSAVQAHFVLQAPGDNWEAALGFKLDGGANRAGVTAEVFEHAITRANFAISRCPAQPCPAVIQRWNEDCLRQDPALPLVQSAFADVVTALRELFGSPAYASFLAEAHTS